jgi:hypothetical protein
MARARELRCHLDFTGGEVTLIPGFASLLKQLRDMGCMVSFISNGSRQLVWWQDVHQCLTAITLSFHIDRASLDHFIRVTQFLSQSVRTHVNVAMVPDRFDECEQAARSISSVTSNVTIALKPLLVDFGSKLYPYTEQQRQVMAESKIHTTMTRKLVSSRGRMEIEYSDGNSEHLDPGQLLAKGMNHWAGWLCKIGLERLSISRSGDIYRGTCQQGGVIGNVGSIEKFDLPVADVSCGQVSCHCLSDIMTTRSMSPLIKLSTQLTSVG